MAEARQTRTENGAKTSAGSGNPLVDFFFQASPIPCTDVSLSPHPFFQVHALQYVSSDSIRAVPRLPADSLNNLRATT